VRGVGHGQRDVAHAVAVAAVVVADLVAGHERAGEDEPDAALLEHVGDAVADTGLQARVGDLGEAERVDVEEGGLGRVARPQLDVVDAVERHEVPARAGRRDARLRGHASPPRSGCRCIIARGDSGTAPPTAAVAP
jgi:hypothetical protein